MDPGSGPAVRTIHHLDSVWVSLQLHPAWECITQLLCALSSPQESCKVFRIFVFIDEYNMLTREQGQSPAPHTWSKRCQIWDDPGVFSCSSSTWGHSLTPRRSGLVNGASVDSSDLVSESGSAEILYVYFKLSKRKSSQLLVPGKDSLVRWQLGSISESVLVWSPAQADAAASGLCTEVAHTTHL